MTTKLFTYLFLVLSLLALTNCEDPVEIPSAFEESSLVVEAWLTNTEHTQSIMISESVDYFLGGVPPVVTGASVQVCKTANTDCIVFTESQPGTYQWVPEQGTTIGTINDDFELIIDLRDQRITAQTTLKRTAQVDSISVEFEEETLRREGGNYAQLYARDQVGQGDTYWVKVWKNDTLLNRPSEAILTFDGAFDTGTNIDGLYFLPPLREINPFDDDGADIPYVTGDSIYVEVHSISNTAWSFLSTAFEQIDNSGIFALPIANARGNITNETDGSRVLGIFNVAEVATISKVIE